VSVSIRPLQSPSYAILTGPVEEDCIENQRGVSPKAMVVDSHGSVYVTGRDNGRDCYFTEKYSSNGKRQWIAYYETGSYRYYPPSDICVDGSGNVYVTGKLGTVVYDSSGSQLWNIGEYASEITVDNQGNAYVVGERGLTKYSDQGDELWYKRSTTLDIGDYDTWSLAVDEKGCVYAMGPNIAYGVTDQYAVVKYDGQGNHQWTAKYTGPEGEPGVFRDMVLDKWGNVYLTGSIASEDDFGYGIGSLLTVKYDALGKKLWDAIYDDGEEGQLRAVAVNDQGDVVVTGYWGSLSASTIKYDISGKQVWAVHESGFIGWFINDNLAIDSLGNSYITNQTYPIGGCVTWKYDPEGVKVWGAIHMSGKDHASWNVFYDAYPEGIAVGNSDNVYVIIDAARGGPSDEYPYSSFMELVKYTE